jgi:NAD kinase
MNKIKKVAITGRIFSAKAKAAVKRALQILKKHKVSYEFDSNFPFEKNTKKLSSIKADIVLVFGGDGSLLYAVHNLKNKIPVLGINCGNRGSLMAFHEREIAKKLPKVLEGKYRVEKRTKISVEADGKYIGEALNEVLVAPEKPGRLVRYALAINGKAKGKEADDGLIIATPTGSTAHAYSAGGPVISEKKNSFVVVRLNPLDRKKKPFVVKNNSRIEVKDLQHGKLQAVLDGHYLFEFRKNLKVRKGDKVQLVKVSK